MNPFPEEIILFLIFGAVLLFQALRARWRRQHGRTSGEREPEPESGEAMETETAPPPAPRTPVLAEGPRRAATPKTRMPAAPAPAPQALRRFSRRSLMGNRRAVQDAVVIAAILRPCHAKRPHEVE